MDSSDKSINFNGNKSLQESVMHASHLARQSQHLQSSIKSLNDFLEGGLPWGSLRSGGLHGKRRAGNYSLLKPSY